MPYKANEPRRHKIPKARYKIENWAEYDAALRQRGSLTVWVTPEAIAAWASATTGRRGRPRDYSDVAIEAGLMLRLASGRPWRQTEGMLGSIMDLLGLELPVPDHTTFSRRSADLGDATALRKASGPIHVVIDSTGLKVFGAGDWLREKHGGKPDRSWRRLYLGVIPTARDPRLQADHHGRRRRVPGRPAARPDRRSARLGDRRWRLRRKASLPVCRWADTRRCGDHPAPINRGAERHGGHHSARPPHPAARAAWPAGMAQRRQSRWPVSRGGRDVSVQKGDRSLPSRSESACTEDRSQSRLRGHQHYDQTWHANLPPDCLTLTGKGEIRPLSNF